MKRKSLLLSLLALLPLSTAWASVEINETNFPDESFRNYLLSQSYGSDGVLTDEEIQSVKSMSVQWSEINSLQGIEFFTALEWLDCRFNQLTSLDVSKNTALEWLDCSYHQLTSLDVSGCTALDGLDCSSNQLTSLDVSKNTALTGLNCSSNQLTSLDVSKNTALTELWCSYNELTSLDVSKNTALTELRCYRNQIQGATMDALVQSLPQASDAKLYVIYFYNEQNVMTVTQVEAAKAKGWIPYYTDGEKDEENGAEYSDGLIWKEYTGSDPSDITSVNANETDNAVYYDLSGRRISGKPGEKGLFVKDGKKVFVK